MEADIDILNKRLDRLRYDYPSAERRYDGPFGKSDRAFAFGALALALGLGLRPDGWLHPLLWILLALAALTILNRARRALAAA